MDERGSVDERGLGRLQRVDVRSVWPNEATDLTPWLHRNMDALAEALGIQIIPVQHEVQVGDFRLDLLGEDEFGRTVIIENQLEATDHGHLGQLLVYASGLDAAVVVWLTPRFRDEHRRSLDWLNERTDEQLHFFGVELDLVRIGTSPPAPVFRVVCQPNDWQKSLRQAATPSEAAGPRQAFLERAVALVAAERPGFRAPKVGVGSWVGMASGPFGYFAIAFYAHAKLGVEAYLDCGSPARNKALFDSVYADRASIEAAMGCELFWQRLDDKRACRISVRTEAPDLADPAASERALRWIADRTVCLMSVLERRLRDGALALRDAAAE